MGRLILILALVTGSLTSCGSGDEPGIDRSGLNPADRAARLETDGCGFASGRTGSGVAIGDGLVITVSHLVVEAESVDVFLAGEVYESAPVLSADRRMDLAVLRIPNGEVSAVEMSAAEKGASGLIVGAAVSGTVSFEIRGVVDLTIEEVFGTARHSRRGYELAASTADGDSGAGAYDEQDRLIGVVFATGQDGATTWVTASSEVEEFLFEVEPSDTYPLCSDQPNHR